MTVTTRKVAPPYSFVVIDDSRGGTPPETQTFGSFLATPSCLLVSCMMFQDGDTEITLGPAGEVRQEGALAFDGVLETPNRVIWITTAEGDVVAKQSVEALNTRIRVWTNHPKVPDRVIVGWG